MTKNKIGPRGQQSECRLATMSHDDSEGNWNRRTDGKDHVLSQADALTKKLFKTIGLKKFWVQKEFESKKKFGSDLFKLLHR